MVGQTILLLTVPYGVYQAGLYQRRIATDFLGCEESEP